MDSLKIRTNYYTDNNNIVIIELGGYIDQTNSGQVEKIISDILKSGKRQLIFDLSELIYMSSAGWGIFVGEIKSVREEGGDIKIAAMSPEVYEVFQMLEFFHIIQDYATVDEAIASYPAVISSPMNVNGDGGENGTDDDSINELLKQSGVDTSVLADNDDDIVIEGTTTKPRPAPAKIRQKEKTARPEIKNQVTILEPPREIDISKLPLNEKIKKVVSNYPLLSLLQIRKMLRHDKFGSTKIGILKLYRTLKFLNLDNKTKRYRFYRST